MDKMIITNARHSEDGESVLATVDGVHMAIPKDAGNRHYSEIMRQSNAGTLTIADAD
jgi:hypothetical protein